MNLAPILDFLRGIFVYVVAIALPAAGVILAIVQFGKGERDEGIRLAAASLLGIFLYLLLLT
jgi:hypothetical protein